MRPKDIIKKVERYKIWDRISNDNWCELETLTIKEILWHHKENNSHFIAINEADYIWPPKWLWQHYRPRILELENE